MGTKDKCLALIWRRRRRILLPQAKSKSIQREIFLPLFLLMAANSKNRKAIIIWDCSPERPSSLSNLYPPGGGKGGCYGVAAAASLGRKWLLDFFQRLIIKAQGPSQITASASIGKVYTAATFLRFPDFRTFAQLRPFSTLMLLCLPHGRELP